MVLTENPLWLLHSCEDMATSSSLRPAARAARSGGS